MPIISSTNFESDGKEIGFQYQNINSALVGWDDTHPEKGKVIVPYRKGITITEAKLQLMAVFCASLTTKEQTTRIYLK